MPISALGRSIFWALLRKPLRKLVLSHNVPSFFWGVALLACLVCAENVFAQTTYRDPNGSFSVDVPAGWQAENEDPQRSRVTVSKDNASVSFEVEPSKDGSTPPPQALLDEFEKRLAKACPQAEVLKRGDANLAGQPGMFFQAACNDPKAGTAILMVQVATVSGQILECNIVSFSADYPKVKPVLDSIINSFRLGAAEARSAGAGNANRASRTPADPPTSSDAQKLRAVEDACASGILSPDECAAKRAELRGSANSSSPSSDNPKLQALEKACKAGVFTPEECAAKRASLKDAGSREGQPNPQPPPTSGSGGTRAPWSDSSGPTPDSNGTPYTDPNGAFRLMIPQGWTAKAKDGCYGPSESCPPGSSGVNIFQGDSWAFVAPFSDRARRPTDVVNMVWRQYQSQYQNLKMIQNEPQKFNGLDIALGQFTGADQNGTNLSLVVIGIAAPNGRFYLACSSIALSDAPTAGLALNSMLQTLQFAGQ